MDYEEERRPVEKKEGFDLYTKLSPEYAKAFMEIKKKLGCSSSTETIIKLIKYFQRNRGKDED